jgi:hypothetical protein
MQKWIFAFATVAGLLIVGYFVKGIMPGPCDGCPSSEFLGQGAA